MSKPKQQLAPNQLREYSWPRSTEAALPVQLVQLAANKPKESAVKMLASKVSAKVKKVDDWATAMQRRATDSSRKVQQQPEGMDNL
jgi:hypothetical protein